ncbi:MAG: alpha/beta hydrolase, partial [Bacilli bacterium]
METTIRIPGSPMLEGTFCTNNNISDSPKPTVILLSGSGPVNRDGNIPNKKVYLNVYNRLAELLDQLGYHTFRFDKR